MFQFLRARHRSTYIQLGWKHFVWPEKVYKLAHGKHSHSKKEREIVHEHSVLSIATQVQVSPVTTKLSSRKTINVLLVLPHQIIPHHAKVIGDYLLNEYKRAVNDDRNESDRLRRL